MFHGIGRTDYQRIQDPAGKIPEDEPVFLLRGQDLLAPQIVQEWIALAIRNHVDKTLIESAIDLCQRMVTWQNEHKAKLPDSATNATGA